MARCADTEKLLVAFHESAHAAVGFALGRTPIQITLSVVCEIVRGVSLYRFYGCTRTPLPHGTPTTVETVRGYATIAAAGSIAEARYCRSLGLPDRTDVIGKGDLANVASAAEWSEADPIAFLQGAQQRASALLDDAAVWRGVEDLARMLGTRWPRDEEPGEHAATISSEYVNCVLRGAGTKILARNKLSA